MWEEVGGGGRRGVIARKGWCGHEGEVSNERSLGRT